MWYRIAADLVVAVHLPFICFVVGGAFLAWRWPKIIWVQLPVMVYGALIEFIGFTVPAHAAGEPPAPPRGRGRVPRRVHRPLPGRA